MNPKCIGTKSDLNCNGRQYNYKDDSDSESDYVYDDLDFLDDLYGNECEESDHDDANIRNKAEIEAEKEQDTCNTKNANKPSRTNRLFTSETSNEEYSKPIRRVSGHSTSNSSRLDSISRRYSSRRKSLSTVGCDDLQVKCKRLGRRESMESKGSSAVMNSVDTDDALSDENSHDEGNGIADSILLETVNGGGDLKPVSRRSIRPNRRRASINKTNSERMLKQANKSHPNHECNNDVRRVSTRRNSALSSQENVSSSSHCQSRRLSRRISTAFKTDSETSDDDTVSFIEKI